MKIVFLSNFYNHHQKQLSEELFKKTGGNYVFIQTVPMNDNRKKLGWGEVLPPFVIESYKDDDTYQKCLELIDSADVVITGSGPEKMIRKRIRSGKLVFRYSERIYKNWRNKITLPLRFVKYHFDNHPAENVYMLCASSYAKSDYAKTHNFINKTFKWGYFPPTKRYEDLNQLMHNKEPGSILCIARFIKCKHIEDAIVTAERLKERGGGHKFNLRIIGDGVLREKLEALIVSKGLTDYVQILGSMKPDKVREYMEKSQVFLFTSDFNEGWGAVVNEAMNSGCACVVSHAAGCAKFLINDGINGFIYKNGNLADLFEKAKTLLDAPEGCEEIGEKAYYTITNNYNASVAAERFIAITKSLLEGKTIPLYTGLLEKI